MLRNLYVSGIDPISVMYLFSKYPSKNIFEGVGWNSLQNALFNFYTNSHVLTEIQKDTNMNLIITKEKEDDWIKQPKTHVPF